MFELRRDSHISIESFHARYKVGLSPSSGRVCRKDTGRDRSRLPSS